MASASQPDLWKAQSTPSWASASASASRCAGQRRGLSHVANPYAHPGRNPGRHPAHKVPAMVSRHEIRRRTENGSVIAPRFGVLPSVSPRTGHMIRANATKLSLRARPRLSSRRARMQSLGSRERSRETKRYVPRTTWAKPCGETLWRNRTKCHRRSRVETNPRGIMLRITLPGSGCIV